MDEKLKNMIERIEDFRKGFDGQNRSLARRPLDLIASYGRLESLQTAAGDRVILLPSRTVPERYFDRSLWQKKVGMGHRRIVYSVDRLTSDEDPELVVRGPERSFTTIPEELAREHAWWNGAFGRGRNNRPIRVDDPVVDEQTLWEAVYLLELKRAGIPAEIPQAIIVDPEGHLWLVVNRIDNKYVKDNGPTSQQLLDMVGERTTLQPVDASANFIKGPDGKEYIIDVNEWRWPPHTDEATTELVAAIQRAIAEKDK